MVHRADSRRSGCRRIASRQSGGGKDEHESERLLRVSHIDPSDCYPRNIGSMGDSGFARKTTRED